jgi:hypothetical protein
MLNFNEKNKKTNEKTKSLKISFTVNNKFTMNYKIEN